MLLDAPILAANTLHENIAKTTRVNLSRGPPDPPRHFRQEDPGEIVMQGFPRISSSCFRLRHFFCRERRFLKIGLLSQITFKSLIQFRLEGREVNLFIHPPTSRSPAPAASTGNNNLREVGALPEYASPEGCGVGTPQKRKAGARSLGRLDTHSLRS